jgi:hypothetical protein
MAVAYQWSCFTAVGDGFFVRKYWCGSGSVISWSVALFPVTVSRRCTLVFGWLTVRCSYLKQVCGPFVFRLCSFFSSPPAVGFVVPSSLVRLSI